MGSTWQDPPHPRRAYAPTLAKLIEFVHGSLLVIDEYLLWKLVAGRSTWIRRAGLGTSSLRPRRDASRLPRYPGHNLRRRYAQAGNGRARKNERAADPPH